MTQFPNSNLQVDSQQWGKIVENSINSIEAQVTQNEKNNDARDGNLKTSVDAIASTLVKVKSLAKTDHKRYDFNGGATPTHTPVLTFPKPDWARSATVLATVMVDAYTLFSGSYGNPISGVARMFVDGVQTTYTGYDFGNTGDPYTAANQRGLYIEAPDSGDISRTVTISHSATHNVGGSELVVHASFANTTSNAITPILNSDPWWSTVSPVDAPLTYADVFNVGLSAANSCSIEIMATVIWNIDPA